MLSRVVLSCCGMLLPLGLVSAEEKVSYAGTFKDARISVEILEKAGVYSGTIRPLSGTSGTAPQAYSFAARDTGKALEGSFEHQGARFTFTATLSGDTLTFTTGTTTYSLKREPVANPLDLGPRSPAPGRPKEAPAQPKEVTAPPKAAPAGSGILRFKTLSIRDRDDMIGGEAVSLLAPVGWKMDGGMVWKPHPVMPAGLAVRIYDPDGLEALETFPALPFSWGGYTGPGTAFPIGSNYLGNEVRPPVRDSAQCLREIVLPRCRANVRARIVKEEAVPELAKEVKAQNPDQFGMTATVTASKVRIEYEENGKAVEEDVYCALIVTHTPASNMTIWMADRLTGLRAAKGKLDDRTKLFLTMVFSSKVNLEWFNKYAQLVQALTRAQMQRIKNAGEISRMISQTSNEISDMMRKTYEERQASDDRIQKAFSQQIRGVDEYYDPRYERSVELPSGYDRGWVNNRGEYVITENPNFNPNVELEGEWHELKKTPE